MSDRGQRASRQEIFERLQRWAGPEAAAIVAKIIAHVQAGENEQGLSVLKSFDSAIGGTGLHSMQPGYKLAGVYRPVTYVYVYLDQSNPERLSRAIIQSACAHVEDVLKEMVRFGFIAKVFVRWPMGRLLRQGFRTRIPDALYNDLLWLNDRINIVVKHDYDAPQDFNGDEPLDSHLFALDEAVAIYLIARRLVVELENLQNSHQHQT